MGKSSLLFPKLRFEMREARGTSIKLLSFSEKQGKYYIWLPN